MVEESMACTVRCSLPRRTGSTGKVSRHQVVARSNNASRQSAPRSRARSTRCQPQRKCATKGRAARARLPWRWTSWPVHRVISTTPIKYAVPAGRPRMRVLIAVAARYTGEAVRGSGDLLGLDTQQASQNLTVFRYSIGKTREIWRDCKLSFRATEAVGEEELVSWLNVYQRSRDMVQRGIVEVIFDD